MKLKQRFTCSHYWRIVLAAGAVAVLAGCAGGPSTPPLPQTDATGQPILEADDVAIAGQMAAHSIMDLSDVANATTPPMVRFNGVTTALAGVDPEPYTELLRDRMLLITREKLRFEEHTLPPLHGHKKSADETPAQYALTAALGSDASPDTYLIRIEFVELGTGQSVFSGLYRIRPEAPSAPSYPGAAAAPAVPASNIESTAPTGSQTNPPYPPGPVTPVNIQ